MAKNDNLTPRQKKAIAAMLTEKDVTAAAVVAGVSAPQLRRWLGQPEFKDELQAASLEVIRAAIIRLTGLTTLAIDTLADIMRDTTASPGTRLQAVNIHLARLLDLRESLEIETRLTTLEKQLHIG